MFKLLQHFFSPKKHEQLVGVIQYPNKIIVETYHKADTGVYLRSSYVSIISVTASQTEIGEKIFEHLKLSKAGINYARYDSQKSIEDYKKITKLTSIKEQMKDSKYVSVRFKNDSLFITPNINGGTKGNQKGYREKKELERVSETLEPKELGKIVIEAWKDCE